MNTQEMMDLLLLWTGKIDLLAAKEKQPLPTGMLMVKDLLMNHCGEQALLIALTNNFQVVQMSVFSQRTQLMVFQEYTGTAKMQSIAMDIIYMPMKTSSIHTLTNHGKETHMYQNHKCDELDNNRSVYM